MKRFKFVFLLFALPLITICKGEIKEVELKEDCNILSPSYEECFFPYPTTQFYNGKLKIPLEFINTKEMKITLERIQGRYPGFSPANQIAYWDPKGFSKDGLPKPIETIDIKSKVLLIGWDKEIIPILVEPDAYGKPPNQILYIRPLKRMKKMRYVVVIKKGIRGYKGEELNSPQNFEYLKEGRVKGRWQEHFNEIFSFLESLGIKRDDILVAWDFPTAGDDFIIGEHMLKVKKFIENEKERIRYEVKSVEENPYNDGPSKFRNLIKKKVEGVLYVPSVKNAFPKDFVDESFLKDFPDEVTQKFLINVPNNPDCLTLRVLIFGHGLFGSTDEMKTPPQRYITWKMCVVEIGISWQGINDVARGEVIKDYGSELKKVWYVVDNLIQGHANFLALSIIARKKEFWQSVLSDIADKIDLSQISYLGISNGAIQGGTFMALSDVERGILQVGGAIWTSMLERNYSWLLLKPFITKDEKELKKLILISQLIFDIVDPITFAPYILGGSEEFEIKPKQIFVQEAIGDEQVANFTTRTYVRTAGIKGISKLIEKDIGIEEVASPQSSGYIQYDTKPDKIPPEENLPLLEEQKSKVRDFHQFYNEDVIKENGEIENKFVTTHEAVRRLPVAVEQMKRFIWEGKIYQFCSDSVCDPD